MTGFERFTETFLNMEILARYAPSILKGVWVTIELSVLIVASGLVLGTVLACVRAYRLKALSALIVIFADIFRSLPPLVLILMAYFGLPNLGISLSAFVVLYLILTLTLAAFAEEIVWAGITATPRGQWEVARSTGMSFSQTLLWVVLPQAVRMVIPPLTNRAIAITKMTALGSVIGVPDILNQATTAQSFSGNASPLLLASALYVLLFLPLVIVSRRLETRFSWKT